MANAFGQRLQRRRLSEGLSQKELGDKIGGVSQTLVSFWETGKSEPNEAQLSKLEKVLGPLGDLSPSTELSERERPTTGALGAWLRKARAAAGLSVAELADASGLTRVAIYNIESGRSLNPRSESRARLAKALKTTVPGDVTKEAEQEQEVEGLGSLTDFDPHNDKDRPAAPGVYVFYDVSDRPVYVGKSQEISKRVGEHAKNAFWFRRPIVDHGAYLKIADPKLRHQVEQVLIKFLKSNAVLNEQSVDR